MARIYGDLPDYLAPNLSILFVGINPGRRSSEVGHHFAGPSNRFWKLLCDAELVPHRMTYYDDARLIDYGYGLTNLIAKPTVGIQDLVPQDFLQGREILCDKIEKFQPAMVAILGLSVAQVLWPTTDSHVLAKKNGRDRIRTGIQSRTFAGARVFVLPNPSGRNAHYSYQILKGLFVELKEASLDKSRDSS